MTGYDTPELVIRLRDVGLRVTPARVAVLKALQRARYHLPAESIAGAVRPHLRSVSTQAIYMSHQEENNRRV